VGNGMLGGGHEEAEDKDKRRRKKKAARLRPTRARAFLKTENDF
jgi:hypothetical protein